MQWLVSAEAFDGSHMPPTRFPVFGSQMERDCVCIKLKISNQMLAVASRTRMLHLISVQDTGSSFDDGNKESCKCRID